MNGLGVPLYPPSPSKTFTRPAPYTSICHGVYEAATDSLYIGGYTSANRRTGGEHGGSAGTVVCRYDKVIANNSLGSAVWQTVLPYGPMADIDGQGEVCSSFAAAGDYVFAVRGIIASVYVYHKSDGVLSKVLRLGAEVAGWSGWIDIQSGLNVHLRGNGEYVLMIEDDTVNKTNIIRWKPGATPLAAPSQISRPKSSTPSPEQKP